MSAFERASKIMPNYQQAWEHLGAEYRLIGRPAEAQQAASRAAQLKTASARAKKKG